MNDITEYRRRPEPARMVVPNDPKVIAFLEQHEAQDRERHELLERCERQVVDMMTMSHRVDYLERELRQVRHQRDSYQRGYLEIKAQLSIFATGAIKCLEVAKSELIRDGVAALEPEPDALDDGAAEIGRRFAAHPVEELVAER